MPMKLRHILVLSDLSEESLRACTGLTDLVTDASRITLLHIVEELRAIPHGSPFAPMVSSPETAEELDKARHHLEQQRKSLPAGIDVKLEVITAEKLAPAVTAYADAHEVDMIALSTHGRTGFRHLVLGSVAEAVLRHSHVPVLCFPRTR